MAAPVPNATVLAKGTKIGVATGVNGSFTLSVPQSVNTLVVSSVNFVTKEVDITSSNAVTINLQPSTGNLSEVVVVAYGTQKKTNVTGSVATVKGHKLQINLLLQLIKHYKGLRRAFNPHLHPAHQVLQPMCVFAVLVPSMQVQLHYG